MSGQMSPATATEKLDHLTHMEDLNTDKAVTSMSFRKEYDTEYLLSISSVSKYFLFVQDPLLCMFVSVSRVCTKPGDTC